MDRSSDRQILDAPYSKEGIQTATTQLTPKSEQGTVDVHCDQRKIIPIVFLPGVMGSILQDKDKNIVWNPPAKMWMLDKYKKLNGKERQLLLDPKNTEVSDNGEIISGFGYQSEQYLRDRKWGRICADNYHEFMLWCENWLNYFLRTKINNTQDILGQFKDLKCTFKEKITQTDDELKTTAKYRFEIWGGGYNWTKSNDDSADEIIKFINEVIEYYKKQKNVLAVEKVILVTHSMGGIVARAVCKKLEDAKKSDPNAKDLVLGVIHGAMPANGTVEMYTAMRKGFESGFSLTGHLGTQVLGDDASKVTPVFTQCQSALELLPFAMPQYNPSPEQYRVSPPKCLSSIAQPGAWLYVRPKDDPSKILQFDMNKDICRDVYKSSEWWGLLPKGNEDYFDPVHIVRKQNDDTPLRSVFENQIDKAQDFHDMISGYYHDVTYGIWSASKKTSAIGEALWDFSRINEQRVDEYSTKVVSVDPPVDTGQGAYMYQDKVFNLQNVYHCGDGTVPRASWQKDLGKIKNYCLVGDNSEDSNGFGHQNAFIDSRVRYSTIIFTLKLIYAIKSQIKE